MDVLKRLFEQHFHAPAERAEPLKGQLGGSGRTIVRLTGAGKNAIGILYSVREENAAFLEFSRHFRRHGLPVPEIYRSEFRAGELISKKIWATPRSSNSSASIARATRSRPRPSRPTAKWSPCCRVFRWRRVAI